MQILMRNSCPNLSTSTLIPTRWLMVNVDQMDFKIFQIFLYWWINISFWDMEFTGNNCNVQNLKTLLRLREKDPHFNILLYWCTVGKLSVEVHVFEIYDCSVEFIGIQTTTRNMRSLFPYNFTNWLIFYKTFANHIRKTLPLQILIFL